MTTYDLKKWKETVQQHYRHESTLGYYTFPQSFGLTFSYSLAQQPWGLLLNFDLQVHWEVHQFISHHLISLDPCNTQIYTNCIANNSLYLAYMKYMNIWGPLDGGRKFTPTFIIIFLIRKFTLKNKLFYLSLYIAVKFDIN